MYQYLKQKSQFTQSNITFSEDGKPPLGATGILKVYIKLAGDSANVIPSLPEIYILNELIINNLNR